MAQSFSEVVFGIARQKTALVKNVSIPPLKIIPSASHSKAAFCFLSNYGAGFVAGDHVELEITAQMDTISAISTQGNTRVYKSMDGVARQHIRATLEKDAFHVFFNDPLVMHRSAAFFQKSEWGLASGAVLLLIDWFSAGRSLNGENYDFNLFESDTKIKIENQPVIWDRFQIDPKKQNVNSPGNFKGNNTYLNIFLVGNESQDRVRVLENHLNVVNRQFCPTGSLQAGSHLVGGAHRINRQAFMVRYSAKEVADLHMVVKASLNILENHTLLGFNLLGNRLSQ